MPDTSVVEVAARLGIPLQAAEAVYQHGLTEGEKRARISGVRTLAKDIPLGIDLYRQAAREGMSLSAFLEKIDPSDGYNDGLDAFQRQLVAADIRVRSDLLSGVPAHPVERFWNSDKPGTQALFPEFVNRTWRAAALGSFSPEQTRFYQSSAPISDVLYPAAISNLIRQKQIASAIPLSALIAYVNSIDSATYVAHYLTDDSDERTMKRVAEGTEVPTAVLTGSDHTIRLRKYGRRLKISYEAVRRSPIDRLALHLALLAAQAEADKVNTAIDVAINGDGNGSTAATNSNLTAMDTAAVAGTLTLKGYLNWLMQWANPYNCNVILGRAADVLQALLLNVGSANVPFFQLVGNFQIGGLSPINPGLGNKAIGWTTAVTDRYFLGIDSRFGLEMVMEAGATLTETDRIISSQFNEIVVTESLGFAVFDPNANKTLAINA